MITDRWRRLAAGVAFSTVCILVTSCRDASSPSANVLALSFQIEREESSDDGVSIASNTWRALPSLVTPRLGHAAVSLSGCVWAIGGTASRIVTTPFNSVERYCPSIDATRWSAGAPLPEARTDFAGVGVIANKIYAAGGVDASGVARRSLYVYGAATGWSLSPDSLPSPMACGGGGAVVGGKLYVWAGDLDIVDPENCTTFPRILAVYDPAKLAPPRWTILPATPPSDETGGCYYAMTALRSTLYFVGGGECGFPFYASNFKYGYNTSTATWVSASLLFATAYPAALTLSNRIFVFGGYDSDLPYFTTNEAWSFDPATASRDALPLMQNYRNSAAAAALANKIIIVGGSKHFNSGVTGTAEQLTIVTGCDVHEPDGTKATATPWPTRLEFGLGSSMTQAKICTANDVDNFFLERYGGRAPSIQMTPPAGTDYELILLDSTGTVVQRSSLVGSVMETVNIPVGLVQFFVRVRSQDGTFSARAAYRLELLP